MGWWFFVQPALLSPLLQIGNFIKFKTEASFPFFENSFIYDENNNVSLLLSLILLTKMLTSEHTSKGNGKTEMF